MAEASRILHDLYYDTKAPYAYSTATKLYREAKRHLPAITLGQVEDWLKSQETYQRFAQSKHKFQRATFIEPRPGRTWTADLADMSKLAKENKGYKWLLVVCDMASRFLIGLVPQKNKTGQETAQSFQKLLSEVDTVPKILFTDKG